MSVVPVAHSQSGTEYGANAAKYATAKHGPDGAQFLDPVFLPNLDNLIGQHVIDIGCGAGPWSVYAANQGAKVFGIDYQIGMLKNAKKAVTDADVNNKVVLANADGAALPAADNEFSLALSINVGCNLPNTSTVEVNVPEKGLDYSKEVGFEPHFKEMARVLKKGGRAVVTAPTSFGEVFTRGDKPKAEVIVAIQKELDEIGGSKDPTVIKSHLDKLENVYRATIAWRNDKWVLITDESQLKSGETIWRKLPGLTVPNFYHNENEYAQAAEKAGLKVVEVNHELFKTENEREQYNISATPEKQLGPEYSEEVGGKPPFVVYIFEKSLPSFVSEIRIIGRVTDANSAANVAGDAVKALSEQSGGQ